MYEHTYEARVPASWLARLLTAVLAAAALVAVGSGLYQALKPLDTEALESPLLLAIARQLVASPWELYGPYGGANPLVLIHAPFYYHLAALLAWPLHALGWNAETAALVSGRSLSFLGLVITLGAIYRLARLDGAPARAGWWAICLVASSPVVGVIPFTVRPDMLGVGLQTTGVLLVLSALRSEERRIALVVAAFAAFGVALCIKQHYIVCPGLCVCLLVAQGRHGRMGLRGLGRGALAGLVIVLFVYAAEELATGGRMSQAVFRAAAQTGRVHPGGWVRAYVVVFAVVAKSSGLVALLIAAGLAGLGPRRRFVAPALVVVGTALIGVFAVLIGLSLLDRDPPPWERVVAPGAVVLSTAVVLPLCFILARSTLLAEPLDRLLLVGVAAEGAAVVALSYVSTGAWVNYGIQAVVFAAILTSRSLSRACTPSLPRRVALLVAAAALVARAGPCADAAIVGMRRRVDPAAARYIIGYYKRPATEFFFVDRPGLNRVNGRLDLVYDHWLYPVFESLRLAEPRSSWLAHVLSSGSTRYVVTLSDSPRIDGLGASLRELGYVPRNRLGTFHVWERVRPRSPR